MKKTLVMLILLAVFVGGCTPPQGIRSALYTAQIVLDTTIKEVAKEENVPWKIPDNATMEEKLALREYQVIILTKTMSQANENLKTVIVYYRGNKGAGE